MSSPATSTPASTALAAGDEAFQHDDHHHRDYHRHINVNIMTITTDPSPPEPQMNKENVTSHTTSTDERGVLVFNVHVDGAGTGSGDVEKIGIWIRESNKKKWEDEPPVSATMTFMALVFGYMIGVVWFQRR